MTPKKNNIWDVVVVGGGPAGMMAAGKAGERGKKVLLLEKNSKLGKKLLITGGGRCNLTNNRPEIRGMLSKYKGSGDFLFSAFSQFGAAETLDFFHKRGMPTKEETEGRVFPVSNKAESVWNALQKYLKDGKVEIKTDAEVQDIARGELNNFSIRLKGNKKISAQAIVIATGGMSHKETGSTGAGFLWLKNLGHEVLENNFALVPVALTDSWPKKLGGVTLKDTKLTTYQNGKKYDVQAGKLLFTHFGISGPTVLNMSKDIGELLQGGEVVISLDLFPNEDTAALKAMIQKLLIENSNKMIKNTLAFVIPAALVSAILPLCGVSADTPNHSVRSEDRKRLITLLKGIPLHVKELVTGKAVVSSGGVALPEVNFKTMESRVLPGVYIVGDVLNINRPSGGYSLQICWTTGYVAGNSC